MESEIRQLIHDDELIRFARICNNAYPALTRPPEESLERYRTMVSSDHDSEFWGLFKDRRLLGGMRLLDFQMNYFGTFIPVGGVGSVAVDLPFKKQGCARRLIEHFLDDCEERGQYLAMLYPFKPGFYRQMGFGHGPKMAFYRFNPLALPDVEPVLGFSYLTPDDAGMLRKYCDEYAASQHGYCLKSQQEMETLLKAVTQSMVVGYKKSGRLYGYLSFGFRRVHENNPLKNDLIIREWQWTGPEAFMAFCRFLRSQADQVERIVFATQQMDLHYLLEDVGNGTDNFIPSVYHESYTAGVGLMHRIVSVPKFIEATSFRNYNGQTLHLELEVEDSFRPRNSGTYHLSFHEGHMVFGPRTSGGIHLYLDIGDLTSLLMGCVDLNTLCELGRTEVSQEARSLLRALFDAPQRPRCITPF